MIGLIKDVLHAYKKDPLFTIYTVLIYPISLSLLILSSIFVFLSVSVHSLNFRLALDTAKKVYIA